MQNRPATAADTSPVLSISHVVKQDPNVDSKKLPGEAAKIFDSGRYSITAPNGKIWFYSRKSGINIMDSVTGSVEKYFKAESILENPQTLKICPNGNIVCGIYQEKGRRGISIYDSKTERLIDTLAFPVGGFSDFAVIDDDHLIVIKLNYMTSNIMVWNIKENIIEKNIEISGEIEDVQYQEIFMYSPTLFLICGVNDEVSIFDLGTGKVYHDKIRLKDILVTPDKQIWGIARSGDCSLANEAKVLVYEIKVVKENYCLALSNECALSYPQVDCTYALPLTEEGLFIRYVGNYKQDAKIEIWDTINHSQIATYSFNHTSIEYVAQKPHLNIFENGDIRCMIPNLYTEIVSFKSRKKYLLDIKEIAKQHLVDYTAIEKNSCGIIVDYVFPGLLSFFKATAAASFRPGTTIEEAAPVQLVKPA